MVKVLKGEFCGELAVCPDVIAENAEYGCGLAIIKVHVSVWLKVRLPWKI
jgi:hypothetical protein